MNLIASAVLALAGATGHPPPVELPAEAPADEPRIVLQLACAVARELRLPSTCSEIQLRIIVAMSRPQLV
jgi:hypothetical protein